MGRTSSPLRASTRRGSAMTIDDILSQLGSRMGLPDLRLDEGRACQLIFDGRVAVDIELVFLHSTVGIVRPEGREVVFQHLLEANLFGRGTGGAVLSVDGQRYEILLHRSLQTRQIDFSDFVDALEQFIQYASHWMERLAQSHGAAPPSAAPLNAGGSTALRG
ncbi:MAG: CesT family type III secretion system chaperone [Oxalobacteraceae bacterium]|nr:CesT family type III secretion system chaperone [Oxalobacteraceae bacterium]